MTATEQTITPREPEPESWGELGPCMKALNTRHRAFVRHLLTGKPGYGSLSRAYRLAGYRSGKAATLSKDAHHLSRDERIIAAINEEAKKVIRGVGHAEATAALMNLLRNVEHRDHARAIGMVLARTDPEIQRHDLHVTHKIDPISEELEELAAARALGADHAMLTKLFGGNRLPVLERLEQQRNSDKAKIVDAEVIEGTIDG